MGKEKENKKRTKKVKHITYSALSCCFQKPTCPQEPLFWDTWKFSMFGHSEQREETSSVLLESSSYLVLPFTGVLFKVLSWALFYTP